MTPFVSYLLKLNQSHSLYASVVNKKFVSDQWDALKWKLHNYLSLLSQITQELNRLGRYYKEELMGPWVLLDYRMSIDIKTYCDLLVTDVAERAAKCQQDILL